MMKNTGADIKEIIALHIGSLGAEAPLSRVNAAKALVQLAEVNEQNKDVLREAGGLVPLLRCLSDESAEVRLHAAGALRNIVLNAQNQDAIRAAGGLAYKNFAAQAASQNTACQ